MNVWKKTSVCEIDGSVKKVKRSIEFYLYWVEYILDNLKSPLSSPTNVNTVDTSVVENSSIDVIEIKSEIVQDDISDKPNALKTVENITEESKKNEKVPSTVYSYKEII